MQKGIDYEIQANIGLIVAGYIFALLGGWIGFLIGLNLIMKKVELWSGSHGKKYNKSSRTHGAIMILVPVFCVALFFLLSVILN